MGQGYDPAFAGGIALGLRLRLVGPSRSKVDHTAASLDQRCFQQAGQVEGCGQIDRQDRVKRIRIRAEQVGRVRIGNGCIMNQDR